MKTVKLVTALSYNLTFDLSHYFLLHLMLATAISGTLEFIWFEVCVRCTHCHCTFFCLLVSVTCAILFVYKVVLDWSKVRAKLNHKPGLAQNCCCKFIGLYSRYCVCGRADMIDCVCFYCLSWYSCHLCSVFISVLTLTFCVSLPFLHSFGKQLGGRRGCECITLEPSEMIVVSRDTVSCSPSLF